MSGAKALRRVRAGEGVIVLFEAGGFVFEMLRGHVAGALVFAACAVAVALAMLWLTGKIRQREHLDRPRPDYPAIARMEMKHYGRTFEHDGAPEPASGSVSELHAMMDDLAELATARIHDCDCDNCGIPFVANHFLGGRRCPQCYRRDREYKPSNLRWERPS